MAYCTVSALATTCMSRDRHQPPPPPHHCRDSGDGLCCRMVANRRARLCCRRRLCSSVQCTVSCDNQTRCTALPSVQDIDLFGCGWAPQTNRSWLAATWHCTGCGARMQMLVTAGGQRPLTGPVDAQLCRVHTTSGLDWRGEVGACFPTTRLEEYSWAFSHGDVASLSVCTCMGCKP